MPVNRPRLVDEWLRPEGPPYRPAIRVASPHGGLSTISEWPAEKDTVWIPSAGPGTAVLVSVIFTPPTRTVGWPGQQEGADLLGKRRLGHETVWVLSLPIDLTDLARREIGRARRFESLPEGAQNLRQFIHGHEYDGGRFVIEMGLYWEEL